MPSLFGSVIDRTLHGAEGAFQGLGVEFRGGMAELVEQERISSVGSSAGCA